MADTVFRGGLQTRILPLSSVAAVGSQAWVGSVPLALIVGTPTVWRKPLVFRIQPLSSVVAVSAQDWVWTNGLPVLFVPTVPGPLGIVAMQYDWPVPRGPQFPADLRTWLDSLKLNLQGQDFLPFRLSEWPVPRGYVPAIDLKTWLDPLKLNLLGQDQFFGQPGQPPANLDWPVPRGPLDVQALRIWLQLIQIVPPAAATNLLRMLMGIGR